MMNIDAVAQKLWEAVADQPMLSTWPWDSLDDGLREMYRRYVEAAIDAMGLMEERRTCQDGFAGVSSQCDAAGRIIGTTSRGRSPTEMRRFVTAWEVSREW